MGKDGLLQSITDVSNVPLTIGDHHIDIPAKNGDDIVLTIDRNVQVVAEQALTNGLAAAGQRRGSVIVMDPQNGQSAGNGKYIRLITQNNIGKYKTPAPLTMM